ncbi:MAG TPA: cyanophycinase [Vicinamibacterales bacterium]|nr:cyanophycinase [Vicinamibacterales bacterium]
MPARRIHAAALAALLFAVAGRTIIAIQSGPGPLVVVGGGGTTDDIVKTTLTMAGGSNAVVAVLPQSSAVANAGESSVKMWLDAGAKSAAIVRFEPRDEAAAALERATLIWMPGGDQNRFMKAIAGTGLDDVIRARHRAGAVVGGTSAGAAVLSEAMITGDADLQSLTAGKTTLAKGLGLWPGVIVDQHFLRRQRINRLLSAVLDRPALVGIGIDEATAVVVRGEAIEVIGRSAVVVIDPRGAAPEKIEAGQVSAGQGLKLSVLRAGMTYSLQR